ncbi:MAG: hypothetical protein HYX69_03925 [Planctomycetia bacterium]|nr:hypothetical protein [Planctomycetia bacterium]
MTPGPGSLAYRRLRAPREHGGVLIEPPLAALPPLVAAAHDRRNACDYNVQGRPLSDLAVRGRTELVELARRYTSAYRAADVPSSFDRVLVAGHQPELFHPGVWFKNFALSRLAREHGAVAVNLLVDSDTIKHVALRVPGGSLDAPVVESVPFDAASDEIPYEERDIEDRSLLASFGRRARDVLRPIVADPLLASYWPLVLARAGETRNLGECLAQARHVLEGQWGLSTLEIPQSHVCSLESFHWFTAHLLAQLPRLRAVYNGAVDTYRRVNRVRSANHPAPNLAADGEWLEAPYWLWSTASPRRRRLFVRRDADGLVLTDRRKVEIRLSLSAEGDAGAAVEILGGLAARGVKLRSRALITTLFARLVLADLFIHGIGGAKYDQLTDELIGQFFGIEPPAYLVLSATLHLTGAQRANGAGEIRRLDRELRDLEYHPETYLARLSDWGNAPVDIPHWLELKSRWRATEQTRANARERCHAIRAANEALQAWIEPRRRELLRDRQEAVWRARAHAVLTSREYAFALYPEPMLRDFLLDFPGTTL